MTDIEGTTTRREALRASKRRSSILATPLAIVSAIAVSLNFASPAQANTSPKPTLKPRTAIPTPKLTVAPASVATSAAPASYLVVEGDTISGIAARFGLSTAAVLAQNGLGWSALIFPGQQLTLGDASAPEAAPVTQPSDISKYSVVAGDTMSGIAAAHGLTLQVLLSANGLDAQSLIFPGQTLVLPDAAGGTPQPVAPEAPHTAAPAATHTVATGDTISAIADAAGVSIQALLDANALGWASIIYPGQTLTLPIGPALTSVAAVQPLAETPPPAVDVTPSSNFDFSRIVPLSDEMRANARTIIDVARSIGASDQAIIVALATAAQESSLRNLDHGDRDSLGLFQQRPSTGWGTPEQVRDPVYATLAFFGATPNAPSDFPRGLFDIDGWQSMSLTQAAQAVQISAHPDFYEKWEPSAASWLAELD